MRQFLLDLGEMEGEYRAFHLKDDIRQSSIYIIIATVSVVSMIGADHFKNINDTYGHYAGDLVLRSLSLVILDQKRAQDLYGRLGGEEFALLLPETNLQQAKVVAERVQKVWAQTPCSVDGQSIHSTESIGVAEANDQDGSFEDILRRADRMMYRAKEAGRNSSLFES